MSDEVIQPVEKAFSSSITPPPSKSLSNRALVLAALSSGQSMVRNLLLADDTRVMIDGLRKLGFEISLHEEGSPVATINGLGGKIPASSAELFCGNSGTTIRFLAAVCALGHGNFILDGVERMRQRPIGEQMQMLRDLGVHSKFLQRAGFPPVQVEADGLPGGLIQFGAAQSSQFLSAVLMIAPCARHELKVDLIGRQTSWPYVAMTMQLMDEFGLTPELLRDPSTGMPRQIVVPQGGYAATEYRVEPDASNAAYFMAAAAMHEGSQVVIRGLGRGSLQGDVGFAEVLKRMGATVHMQKDCVTVAGSGMLRGIEVDLSPMPDTAQTLAVAALRAEGRTIIRGLHTLRVKETDRLAATATELKRLGANVEIEGDSLHIDPPEQIAPAEVRTYDDHRMAMSFALAATAAPGIVIKDAQCVQKTYPNYFHDLRQVLGSSGA
jgi:3-phosphoshikimate 1-carboxyvinyltransferase